MKKAFLIVLCSLVTVFFGFIAISGYVTKPVTEQRYAVEDSDDKNPEANEPFQGAKPLALNLTYRTNGRIQCSVSYSGSNQNEEGEEIESHEHIWGEDNHCTVDGCPWEKVETPFNIWIYEKIGLKNKQELVHWIQLIGSGLFGVFALLLGIIIGHKFKKHDRKKNKKDKGKIERSSLKKEYPEPISPQDAQSPKKKGGPKILF